MPQTMTYEEWVEKKAADKAIREHLEKARQLDFAREQQRESVLTRPSESIVDADSV